MAELNNCYLVVSERQSDEHDGGGAGLLGLVLLEPTYMTMMTVVAVVVLLLAPTFTTITFEHSML